MGEGGGAGGGGGDGRKKQKQNVGRGWVGRAVGRTGVSCMGV